MKPLLSLAAVLLCGCDSGISGQKYLDAIKERDAAIYEARGWEARAVKATADLAEKVKENETLTLVYRRTSYDLQMCKVQSNYCVKACTNALKAGPR